MKKFTNGKIRKVLGGLAIVGSLAGLSQSASAIASIPTTGVCGFAVTNQYPFVYLYGASPGTGWGMNFLGTIDFGASKISGNIILQNPNGAGTTESQATFSASFTTAAGPITGSYTISFVPTPLSTNTMTINIIPVNGGNTVLLQGFNPTAGSQDAGSAGVCQF